MFLINKIKYIADNNYNIYENKINNYYYKFNNKENFLTKDLTSYIYKFYIQNNLYGICYDDKTNIFFKMIDYVKKLYIAYYTFYIKDIINNGDDFIITEEIINNFNKTDKIKLTNTYDSIKKYSNINIKLDLFLLNIFKIINIFPAFSYGGCDIYDIYIYLSKLLDFIIGSNMDKIILSIALGHI